MARSYTTQTNSNTGITYTTEHDTDDDSPGGIMVMLVLGFIIAVVACIAQLVYVNTGANVFDSLDGVTGPCNHCTTTTEGN